MFSKFDMIIKDFVETELNHYNSEPQLGDELFERGMKVAINRLFKVEMKEVVVKIDKSKEK